MDEIIDYTTQTPENTNPNVLRSIIENYNNSIITSGEGIGSTIQGLIKQDNSDPNIDWTNATFNTATGNYSHAEGGRIIKRVDDTFNFMSTSAEGAGSHAEGYGTQAIGQGSHAEGGYTFARGNLSHSEGFTTAANGLCSHTEGTQTAASGNYSHVEGIGTIATNQCSHVFGRYNIVDRSIAPEEYGTYVEIVGNGTTISNTSNARTLDWQGNESLAGNLTLGQGTEDEVTITPTQLKQLLALLN